MPSSVSLSQIMRSYIDLVENQNIRSQSSLNLFEAYVIQNDDFNNSKFREAYSSYSKDDFEAVIDNIFKQIKDGAGGTLVEGGKLERWLKVKGLENNLKRFPEDIKAAVSMFIKFYNVQNKTKAQELGFTPIEQKSILSFKDLQEFQNFVSQIRPAGDVNDDASTAKYKATFNYWRNKKAFDVIYGPDGEGNFVIQTNGSKLGEEAHKALFEYQKYTNWCTANGAFKGYVDDGPLYSAGNLNNSESETREYYQIHIPTLQFMDRNDQHCSIG